MNFVSQIEAIDQLTTLARGKRHSILVAGVAGSGKTYLASMYGKFLNIADMVNIPAQVSEIRNTIDECYQIENDILVCVENLDTGVAGAAYALLKFLEEPAEHVYIVITCRNIERLPDTIISRSAVVTVPPPLPKDVDQYAQSKDANQFIQLKTQHLWKCVRSFQDADTVLHMTPDKLLYYNSLMDTMKCKGNISSIVWKLGHYDDNTETPLDLVIGYIVANTKDRHVKDSGLKCLADLSGSRIAKHAVLARFVFECKYCE